MEFELRTFQLPFTSKQTVIFQDIWCSISKQTKQSYFIKKQEMWDFLQSTPRLISSLLMNSLGENIQAQNDLCSQTTCAIMLLGDRLRMFINEPEILLVCVKFRILISINVENICNTFSAAIRLYIEYFSSFKLLLQFCP